MSGGPQASFSQAKIVLAALCGNGTCAPYNPVQLQKLLFLIDREIADDIGGPHFDFKPDHYGPYDPSVFDVAEGLRGQGKVIIDNRGPYRRYLVSDGGLSEGSAVLDQMVEPACRYVYEASEWILSQSFRELVSAIYRQYPDMAVNSRIAPSALRGVGRSRRRRMHPFLRGMASVVGVRQPRRGDHVPESGLDRDAMAIASAWRAVGDAFRFAIEESEMPREYE